MAGEQHAVGAVRGRYLYPWAKMDVGDWFSIKQTGRRNVNGKCEVQNRVMSAAIDWGKRNGMRFKVMMKSDIVICERVA